MTAKTVIWHAYENCLPPERRRVTTDKRSANEANLTDIIGAVSDLDAKGKVLSGRFCAVKLDRLPKYARARRNERDGHDGSDEGRGAAIERGARSVHKKPRVHCEKCKTHLRSR